MGCGVFFQAEDGIRVLVRSRGLGDVYKRQVVMEGAAEDFAEELEVSPATDESDLDEAEDALA